MSEQAESAGLHLVAMISDGLPPLEGDKRRMKQILLNLISNAIKFTQAGGTIEVHADHDAGTSRIVIKDSGIGIPPEAMSRILVPFGQVESEVSRRHQGTGLGLPLAKTLVELHGGTLNIASELGRGTTVTVNLPAVKLRQERAA